MSKNLLVIALVGAALAACNPTPERGLCKADADCKEGTHCDVTVGACVKTEIVLCNKDCGEGFLCQLQADKSEKCVLETGKEGTAKIVAPQANSLYKGGVVTVICEAKGPQFRAVKLVETPEGGTANDLGTPTAGGSADQYQATLNVADGSVAEGTHRLGCEVSYGPDDAIQTSKANEVPIVVDRTPPTITHTAPTGWHARSGTLPITVQITDTLSGVNAAAVTLSIAGLGDVPGVAGSGSDFSFNLDLSKVATPTIEGTVTYTISAQDKAGNAIEQEFSMQVDAVAPSASIDSSAQQQWHRYAGGSFSVTAHVAATGAAVVPASVKLSNADHSATLTGTASGADFTFNIDPTAFGHDGLEGAAGWTLEAKDEAGNTGSASGTFQIDGLKPSLTIDPVTAWQKRGANVAITVHASDGGSGLDPASVKVHGGAACTAGSGDAFTCTVSTAAAPAGAETPAFAFTIDAADKAGNAVSADGSLKVDDKAPTLTLTPDGKFYARGATIVVRGNASDAGSGIDPATVKIVSQSGSKTFTGNFDAGSGDITINVLPAQFAPAGQTTTNNVITLFAKDATGLESSQQVSLKIDDQAPTVTVGTLAYPNGGTAILRNASMPITATISDPNSGAGVDNAAVFMEYTKADGSTGKIAPTGSPSGSTYTFTFDAKLPDFKMDSGTVTVTFDVADLAGNASATTTKQVQVTRKLWEFNSGLSAKVNGSVAYSAGKIFFTLNANDSALPNVFAVNASDGTKLWSAKIVGTPTTPVSIGQSEIFFEYTDAASKGNLVAYPQSPAVPASPTLSWQCLNVGNAYAGLAVSRWDWSGTTYETVSAATDKNVVYSMYNDAGCQKANSNSISSSDPSSSTVAISGNRVWYGMLGNSLTTALFDSASGFYKTPGSTPTSGTAALSGAAVKSTGNAVVTPIGLVQEWNAIPSKQYEGTSALFTLPASQPPSLASDTRIYFGTSDGKLFRFDEPSTTPAPGFPIAMPQDSAIKSSPTIDAAGNVYFGTADGFIRAYSATGTALWSYDTSGAAPSAASLSCAGILYVGTSNGRVIALIADGGGLANSSWPRYQHDNKNTGNLATPIYVNGVCQD